MQSVETRGALRFPAKVCGYLMPNPERGSADATRLRHGDLRTMSDEQLDQEKLAVTDAYFAVVGEPVGIRTGKDSSGIRAEEWLLARMYQIEAERRERRTRSKR